MRRIVAWLLVAPCAGWAAIRPFGLERGSPLVPLIAYTPLAAAGLAELMPETVLEAGEGAVGIGLYARVTLAHRPAGGSRGDARRSAPDRGGRHQPTLDHAELRRILETGYEDAAAAVGAGLRRRGRGAAAPASGHDRPRARRRALRSAAVSVHTIPGTDHGAVLAELVLTRG
jgi:hypothetical protein